MKKLKGRRERPRPATKSPKTKSRLSAESYSKMRG